MRFKDELGRDFVYIGTLSDALGYSQKQVKRFIRRHNWINLRRGNKRFVLVDDVLTTHPDILSRMSGSETDKVDNSWTSENNSNGINDFTPPQNVQNVQMAVQNVQTEKYLPLEKEGVLLQKVISTVEKMERTISTVGYIAEDTHRLREDVNKKFKDLKQEVQKPREHKLIVTLKAVALIVIIVGMIGLFIYSYFIFKKLGL